jgi:outer membrane immunogenic protein
MKKVLLVTASLIALGATAPAVAADLAARPYTKAPPMVAAAYDWSGFYIGANGGYGTSQNCWTNTAVGGVPFAPASEGCHDADGGTIGGQVGYRWQAGNWVFGLEAQGNWADFTGSNTSLFFGPPAVNRTTVDALGLFTGQIGYAWNNVLWYVKGGAAVTRDKYEGTALGIVVDHASETRWGGVVGTGIEFGFAPNWSLALEYDHLFMGNRDISFRDNFGLGLITRQDTIRQDIDMVTARINYRFGGPIVAKY